MANKYIYFEMNDISYMHMFLPTLVKVISPLYCVSLLCKW